MEIRCIHRARSALGEGALWVPEEKALYWLDQIRPEIHRLDPATGEDVRYPLALPAQLGALVRHEGGGFMLAASDGISLLSADMTSRTGFVNPIASQPQASFWLACTDRQGDAAASRDARSALAAQSSEAAWQPGSA